MPHLRAFPGGLSLPLSLDVVRHSHIPSFASHGYIFNFNCFWSLDKILTRTWLLGAVAKDCRIIIRIPLSINTDLFGHMHSPNCRTLVASLDSFYWCICEAGLVTEEVLIIQLLYSKTTTTKKWNRSDLSDLKMSSVPLAEQKYVKNYSSITHVSTHWSTPTNSPFFQCSAMVLLPWNSSEK